MTASQDFDRRRAHRAGPNELGAWLLAVVLVATLGGVTDCSGSSEEPVATTSAPTISHGPPNEEAEQMCVVCHTCSGDGTVEMPAPIIDRTHDVCNACHAPDGSVVVHGDASCQWQMDCDAIPPIVNCNDCHTVEYVNDLCEACHCPG